MNALEAAIYQRLTSDDTLMALLASPHSVYAYTSPENASLPLILFFEQVETPTYSFTNRTWTDYLYGIKAITVGDSMSEAKAIDEAVDDLFTDASFTVNGSGVLFCRRENAIVPYPELTDGKRYNHAGGSYRIWTGE